jgi:hypothetical protein
MKQLFLIIIAAALLTACKKESSGPKEILIKKVLVNGDPESEFTYNSDGQMTEEKYYSDGPGAVMTNRSEYHYDNSGNPLEQLSYKMPENKLSGRYIFTLNGQGKIGRNSIWNMSGVDSGKLSFHIDHDYKENRTIKQTWRTEDEEVVSYRTMGYYPNGNMRTSESYWVSGGVAEKKWGSSYGPSDTTLPASFYNIKAYPVNFYYSYLTSSSIMHYTYDDGVVETQYQEIMSGRKFNSKGLLTDVTITTKHIKPVAADEVRTLKFEYVEL